ncbi:MAG: hypothetical protein GXP36_02985 [Actinobacteria bacterium]|nr:hypothetical protein [Actinomycetota bacterium]
MFGPKRIVLVLVALVVVGGVALPTAFASPFKQGFYADSAAHTFLYPDMQYSAANRDWEPWVTNSRSTDYNPTDIDTYKVTYHYNSALTYPYVDLSWWTTTGMTVPGSASCNKLVSGETSKCDHWHVKFNANTTNNATQEFIACQEIGHTLGLGHNNDADNVVEHGSCMSNDEDSYQPHSTGNKLHLWPHDIFHLNAGY